MGVELGGAFRAPLLVPRLLRGVLRFHFLFELVELVLAGLLVGALVKQRLCRWQFLRGEAAESKGSVDHCTKPRLMVEHLPKLQLALETHMCWPSLGPGRSSFRAVASARSSSRP